MTKIKKNNNNKIKREKQCSSFLIFPLPSHSSVGSQKNLYSETLSWRKHYKNQLKRQLAQVRISCQSWQQEASDRDSWCSSVRKASCKLEAERREAAKERCRRWKERAASQSSSAQTFVCPKCTRACASRIGLYTHQRACKNWPSTVTKSSSVRNQLSTQKHWFCPTNPCVQGYNWNSNIQL